MSLIIRLTRMGRKGEARFRVVVAEKRSRRDGKPIETLGWYEKRVGEAKKSIDAKKASYWIGLGAKPSQTVAKLLNL